MKILIPEETVLNFQRNLQSIYFSNKTIMQKLESLYSLLDELNEVLSSHFICQKGCSHCCKMDVIITPLEAEYISIKTGIELSNSRFTKNNKTECPFLKDSICSIYEYRPFACRTYNGTGNIESCKNNNGTLYYSANSNPLYMEVQQWIFNINKENYGYNIKDIRNFFSNTKP